MAHVPSEIPGREIPRFPRLLWETRSAGRASPEETRRLRKGRLARLLEFARRRSPYYRKRCASLPGETPDLRDFPAVTKRDLMENFDEWPTDPAISRETAEGFVSDASRIGHLYLGRYVAFSTSGTTGSPAILLHDAGAMSVYKALFLTRRLATLVDSGSPARFARNLARTATIIATGGHFASSVVEAIVRSRHPLLCGRNRTFSLMTPLPLLVRSLNDYQPAVVGSYPTALTVLAGEQAAGRLRISPALLLSGAERLSAPLAERIAASFRCPLRDTYAASEFMGIAFDCRYGRLHANVDWLVLEPVDARGDPVPPGEVSRTTLLTNLANFVQPLIRYDLGDSMAVSPTPCPCGNPLPVVRPEGRSDETLFLSMEDGTPMPLLPLVLATVVEEVPGVLAYQVLQTGPRTLRLRIEEAPGSDRVRTCGEVLARLRRHLSSQKLDGVTLDMSEELPRSESAGGKLRRFLVERNGR